MRLVENKIARNRGTPPKSILVRSESFGANLLTVAIHASLTNVDRPSEQLFFRVALEARRGLDFRDHCVGHGNKRGPSEENRCQHSKEEHECADEHHADIPPSIGAGSRNSAGANRRGPARLITRKN